MIETYININTNEEEEVFKEKKSMTAQYKLLIMLLIFLSLNFAIRIDAIMNGKLIKYNSNNYFKDIGLVNYNRYYLNNYVPDMKSLDYFNITHVNYDFSLKYNIIRMEYNIQFYEGNDIPITPSDFALYKGLQVICTLEVRNPSSIIYTYPNIIDNKYYQCIEYFDIDEKITIGIKLYQNIDYLKAFPIKFFTELKFNYNNFYYQNENLFDPYFVNNKYINIVQQINKNIDKETPNLKKNYLQYPYCSLKRDAIKNTEKWYFRSIYNDHFCFCVGAACLLNIDQRCKQYFFLSVIDKNQHLYKKTDYLFVDFIFAEYSYDDTYPVFSEMYDYNLPVHYLTENLNIYDSYCSREERCDPILYVQRANYTINGDFVEKYLTLFLKLKAVVCSRQLNFYANVFYVTDYIQYITIGHSMLYFKFFTEEKDLSEKRKFDKIILPPSEKIIKLAKSYGWTDDDILQINFPRWDKFNNLNVRNKTRIKESEINVITENINKNNNNWNNQSNNGINNTSNVNYLNDTSDINNTSNINIPMREERKIFMMFAWRNMFKDCEISNYYFDNISKILENEELNQLLERENVKIYFTIHALVINKYRNTYKSLLYYKKNIEFIEQTQIMDVIANSELIITDYSSLVLDYVYMKKPYIFYIPDLDDPEIEDIYKTEYFEYYEKIKNGKIKFENFFYNVNELINKIIFYINNDFILEDNIKSFYDSFGIQKGNNTEKLINYLIKLK